MVTITSARRDTIPAWALLQRHTLAALSEAALRYAERYTRPDGTLVWARDEWKGMDGSDDAYESAYNFPLLYALGGDAQLLPLAHHLWEGITRQFTAYGQIHREFDAYYDWMHHGESSHFLYYLSLAAPYDAERDRATRFANLYTGDDPAAPNYDRALHLIRAPLNGSRGPRLATTPEDWAELRGIYSQYPAPFTDVPGMSGPIADWTDPAIFEVMLAKFNAHIARGDVPINLIATSLVTHAFLVTGDERYRQWVLDYLGAWRERAAQNGGILPDNVGLSGAIGEYNGGKWWGGYYGWGWPHGGRTLLEATAIAGMNAALLTGDDSHLDLFRSQFDGLWAQGREAGEDGGEWRVPWWRDDAGWREYRRVDARLPIAAWAMTQRDDDRARVERFPGLAQWEGGRDVGWGDEANFAGWYRFVNCGAPQFPEQALQSSYRFVSRRLEAMRNDPLDPRDWPAVNRFENDVHHWLNRNPVTCEGLVQTMWGAPMPIYHGGLLHAPLRYFDEAEERAGLPKGVAALVESVDAAGVVVSLVNLDPVRDKSILVQAGTFGEHAMTGARDVTSQDKGDMEEARLRVELAPAAEIRVRIGLRRWHAAPRYH
jgi:hypothetical protein